MKTLKQPLIVGYILTGILSGHYFFNVVHSTGRIEAFSKIIAILVFFIGLNLSPMVIKEIG
jgi:Kef-type K+ transport system membrane component KefB